MKILLSNDDGYNSKGILILEKSLKEFGEVIVAAPKNNMSASSSCLSVHSKVQVIKKTKTLYIIDGTPADCVHILTRGILKRMPDIVFSGINFGSNLGDDVIYSGTIAAAIEGRFCKFSPVAISIASSKPKYISDLNKKLNIILEFIFRKLYKIPTIYNINIPDLAFNKIKGIKFTSLGKRSMPQKALKTVKGDKIFFNIGNRGKRLSSDDESDFVAVNKGYISITPLNINMIDNVQFEKLRKING